MYLSYVRCTYDMNGQQEPLKWTQHFPGGFVWLHTHQHFYKHPFIIIRHTHARTHEYMPGVWATHFSLACRFIFFSFVRLFLVSHANENVHIVNVTVCFNLPCFCTCEISLCYVALKPPFVHVGRIQGTIAFLLRLSMTQQLNAYIWHNDNNNHDNEK